MSRVHIRRVTDFTDRDGYLQHEAALIRGRDGRFISITLDDLPDVITRLTAIQSKHQPTLRQ